MPSPVQAREAGDPEVDSLERGLDLDFESFVIASGKASVVVGPLQENGDVGLTQAGGDQVPVQHRRLQRRRSSSLTEEDLRALGLLESGNQVVRPRAGLNPIATSLIVINYMSVGYILLPGAFATAGTLLTSIILVLVSLQSYLTSIFVLEACARAEWLERFLGDAFLSPQRAVSTQPSATSPPPPPPPNLTLTPAASTVPPPSSLVLSSIDDSLHAKSYVSDIHLDTDSDSTDNAGPASHASRARICANAVTPDASVHSAVSLACDSGDGAGESPPPARPPPRRRERRSTRNSLSTWSRESVVRIRARKFELSLLQHLFLGRGWNLFFTVTVALDLYGITWAFCSIFGAALADQVPFPGVSWSYELWILVFVLVAIPLSCTSLLDQLYVQLAFLAARLLMVLFMISTLLAAFAHPAGAYFGEQVGPAHDVPLADWSRAIQATTVCCFATAFQFSVPAVGHVSSDKRVLSRIFGSAVAFVFLSNLILALLTAVYFGTATDPSNNLNWAAYHASPFLSKYIVLFAAIDGIAVYPLIAISLGGILMGAVYGEGMLEAELDWKRRTLFRFLASVPQAVGAVFVRDLGAIALYAGIFTVISYTIAPSVLCIASYRRMACLRASTRTAYSTVVSEASHVKLAYALILISVLLIIGVIVDSFFHREK